MSVLPTQIIIKKILGGVQPPQGTNEELILYKNRQVFGMINV